jgi:hypothetical protein
MAPTAAPPEAEPLAVWDTRDHGSPWWDHLIEGSKWATAHIAEAESTYRVEFYLVDAPFAVLNRHQRDEGGRLRWNPETNYPFCREPVVQMLDELPPAHLMGR